MTAAEHRDLGSALKRIRDELQTRFMEYTREHAKSGTPAKQWERHLSKLNAPRSSLDSGAAKELKGEFDPKAYYPGD